jgi:DNA-binding transcriptional ArsR family regulator
MSRAKASSGVAGTEPLPLDRCAVRLVHPERVAEVRDRLPPAESADHLAEIFRVLADPTRLRLITALRHAGELCVCDLAATIGLSETATSQHLRVLRAAHAVQNRRDGRVVYYSLDDAHVELLVDVALEHVAHTGE